MSLSDTCHFADSRRLLWGAIVLGVVACSAERTERDASLGVLGRGDGKFVGPRSLSVDPVLGDLCVVDRSGRIQRFVRASVDGGTGWKFAGSWHLPEYQKGQPTGVQYGQSGRLLVADTHYQRIRIYDPLTATLLRTFGRAGSGPGEFTQIRDVVEDSAGNLYASDFGGPRDRIQSFDAAGRFRLDFGERGSDPGQFRRPQGMAIHLASDDAGETLLVADSCNHRIQRFSLDGEFIETWGRQGRGPGELSYPHGVAVERRSGGDIFVAEWQNNRVQRFDARGRPLGTWGSAGHGSGELATPWDVALGPDGRLLVADFGNNRVQIFGRQLPERQLPGRKGG